MLAQRQQKRVAGCNVSRYFRWCGVETARQSFRWMPRWRNVIR